MNVTQDIHNAVERHNLTFEFGINRIKIKPKIGINEVIKRGLKIFISKNLCNKLFI